MKKITQLKEITLSLFFILITIIGYSQSQTFTNSGIFTVPAGVYQVTVEAWGGGGRGGTCVSQNGMNVGGGGGGGAYAAKSIAVTPGALYTVNIGNGSGTSANGADSWFLNATTILAKGGSSCGDNFKTGGAGGAAALCIGDIAASGGRGADGIDNVSGGGGGASSEAGDTGVAASAFSYLGALSTCGGGNGGNAYTATNGDGSPGTVPGGGGGGGKRNNNNGVNIGWGGVGGKGKVIVRWTLNAVPVPVLTMGPGGVTNNLQLWLRSDLLDGTNTYTDNAPVTTWRTQARGADATKPAGAKAPVYRNSAAYNINFNPVVDFDNPYATPSQVFTENDATREYLTGGSGFYTHEIFAVVIPDVTVTPTVNAMDIFCGDRLPCPEIDKTGIGLGNTSGRFSDELVSYCFA